MTKLNWHYVFIWDYFSAKVEGGLYLISELRSGYCVRFISDQPDNNALCLEGLPNINEARAAAERDYQRQGSR